MAINQVNENQTLWIHIDHHQKEFIICASLQECALNLFFAVGSITLNLIANDFAKLLANPKLVTIAIQMRLL